MMKKDWVTVKNLSKYYRVIRKEPGLKGTLKSFWKPRYEVIKALRNISFSLKAGELVGFIGPNGAGKTTTLKILSGLLYPDQGEVRVLGKIPQQRHFSFLSQISFVMGQKKQLWWNLPPWETYQLNKIVYQIPEKVFKQRLEKLIHLLEVEDLIHLPTKRLSLGQRMKCELIAALLHQPKVLFLDEPTIGLDVVMQKKIRDFIKEYNREKKATIVLTSHYMRDLEELAQRIIIIHQGQIVFDGPWEKIRNYYSQQKLVKIRLRRQLEKADCPQFIVPLLQYPEMKLFINRSQLNSLLSWLSSRPEVEDLAIKDLPIEEIIRRFYNQLRN